VFLALLFALCLNRRPKGLEHLPVQTLVKGDATSTCIAAASVIAKVSSSAKG
jgi:ribonuclease HII